MKRLEKKDYGKAKKQRSELQILLGWVMCWDGERYIQVREPMGDGTRQLYVPVTADKQFILQKAIDLFFPNGKAKKLKIEDYEVDLFNSQQEPVEETATVRSIVETTALQKLRFYLATKQKVPANTHTKSYINTDYSDELVSYKSITSKRKSKRISKRSITSDAATSNKMNEYETNENPGLDGLQPGNIFNESQYEKDHVGTDINEFTLLVNSILDGFDTNENDVDLALRDSTFSIDQAQAPDNGEDNNEKIPQTFENVLEILKESVNTEKSSTFNIFREEIFKCLRGMRRPTFSPFNKIFVKFSDIEGLNEGAIDDGGPTREVFRLVMNYIKDSQMFVGQEKKHISLNATALSENHYYEAGRIIALSLVHGGPAPHFFSNLLFSLLTGEENVVPTFDDVDFEIKESLMQMQDTNDLPDAQNLITETSIFSIAGYNFIVNLEEKPDIIQGTLKFYAVNRIREALAQFIDGLNTCNIYSYLKKFPHLFRSHMCNDVKILTAEEFEELFKISYSTVGSNTRTTENKIITYFRDYLLDCEARGESILGQSPEKQVTLTDILIFATGADQVPPLEFPVTPKITFMHEDTSVYPKANTCSLELRLPVSSKTYEEFKEAMDFGIGNCNSFGFA